MLYLVTPHNDTIKQHIRAGTLGVFMTPHAGRRQIGTTAWAGDNGAFTGFKEDAFMRMLSVSAPYAGSCLFVAVPDVVADWGATLVEYERWHGVVAEFGFPRALVIQDGADEASVPWDDCEALFIGGSTEWKLGHDAAALSIAAKVRGKHVHMGRVNSARRLMYANSIGCDTADGTFLKFGPDKNLVRLLRWLDKLDSGEQMNLFRSELESA